MGASVGDLIAARPRVHLACCFIGIVFSLIVYSLLQVSTCMLMACLCSSPCNLISLLQGSMDRLLWRERIMTEPFGKHGEVFTYSLFLVLANRILTFSVALTVLLIKGLDMKPVAPSYSYAAVSASNVAATTCQYEALKHVSFPLQTLGKCAKMIPVMIWGTIILRKVYKGKDYGLALAITLGCTLFLVSGEIKSKRAASGTLSSGAWGVALMAGYLACDGFTSTFQSRLFKGYEMTIYNQILYTTAFSAAFSLFGLVGSGQFSGALAFVSQHPESLFSILALSAASTSGQLCIVHTIKAFGPLMFATVMTTRQFVSILLSCILFSHPLKRGQWLGTLLVFCAIFWKTFDRRSRAVHKPVPFSEAKMVTGGIAAKPRSKH